MFRDSNLIMVTVSTGILEPNQNEFTKENQAVIEAAGANILTCQHLLGGVGRAVRKKLGTYQLDEIIAMSAAQAYANAIGSWIHEFPMAPEVILEAIERRKCETAKD